MPAKRDITLEWLFSKTLTDPETGCRIWTMFLNKKGYARVNPVRGKTLQAHRIAYEMVRGPIPDGHHIDHLCRNPACINPDHLEPVTPIENMRRGVHGVLYKLPATCRRGHDTSQLGAYERGKGCLICCAASVKRNNDKGNAKRRLEKLAADPMYGTPEKKRMAPTKAWATRRARAATSQPGQP